MCIQSIYWRVQCNKSVTFIVLSLYEILITNIVLHLLGSVHRIKLACLSICHPTSCYTVPSKWHNGLLFYCHAMQAPTEHTQYYCACLHMTCDILGRGVH